ncbi:MAG: response regulator [Acidimicrobiales bacterium]
MTSNPVSVMVVDDQPAFRDAARAVLARIGSEFALIGEAGSGEEAVDLVGSMEPSLVVMDINMGGISGIEAASRIKAGHPEVMIILVSTYREDDLPTDVRTSGASAYVHKEDLSARVLRRLWAEGGDPGFAPA